MEQQQQQQADSKSPKTKGVGRGHGAGKEAATLRMKKIQELAHEIKKDNPNESWKNIISKASSKYIETNPNPNRKPKVDKSDPSK